MAEIEAAKPTPRVALAAGKDALAMLEETPMRCGGCGAKVWPQSVLWCDLICGVLYRDRGPGVCYVLKPPGLI